MNRKLYFLLFALLLSLGMLMAACGGGDDDDDDSTLVDDDDDNDIGDDDSGDDDDDNDDNDDNDNDDNDDNDATPDNEYAAVTCALPDPEGLGAGVTVGGGAITTTITAYVYDDATCEPLASGAATVNGIATDADGKVVLTVAKAATTVTAMAPGYWAWSYKADAAVMYFRLRGDASGTWADSAGGHFKDNGADLDVENPQADYTLFNLGNLLSTPIYIGGVVPGLSRNTLLSTDVDHLLPEAEFDLTYDFDGAETIPLPANIYLPTLDIGLNLVGLLEASASGSNEAYKVPVNSEWDENPIEGFVASATIGEALSMDALLELLPIIIGGGDIMEAIMGLIEPILNDALLFEYQAVNPTWDGAGTPDMDVVDLITAKETVNLTVTNPAAGYDYLAILAGEIPNRALWPMGIKIVASGAATFNAAPVADSDYLMLVAKTNALEVLGGSGDPLELNFAVKFAEDLSEWTGGVTLDDANDFLPVFDSSTEYTAGGIVNWDLAGKATPDAYVIIVAPDAGAPSAGIAFVPGTDSSFNAADAFDYAASTDDVVVIVGLDLPEDVDINEFDPTALIGYNSAAMSIWTNYDLSGLFPTE